MKQIGLFEMRRLEALSNTIFGVAMTLLAYDLPKARRFRESAGLDRSGQRLRAAPHRADDQLHHRGHVLVQPSSAAYVAPEGSRGEVFLNLIFLLSIIILPVTNGLYGTYRLDSVVAVVYGVHLTFVATLNALLWLLALRGRGDPELLATAIFPVFVLLVATGVAVSPHPLRNSHGAWHLARLWRAGWRPGVGR